MLRKLLPHAAIILSGMYFVFFFIDRVNPAMAFIDHPLTKGLLFALGVVSVVNAVLMIRDDRARRRRRLARRSKRGARGKG